MNKKIRIIGLIVTVLVIVGVIVLIQSNKGPAGSVGSGSGDGVINLGENLTKSQKASVYRVARKIENPSGFVNTDSISIEENIGDKVILVDFWTYSCINCQRTFPYLKSWWEKYKDDGLLIIGVHTPEFSFEKKRENVVRATEKFGIDYPVVMDNDYSTWRNYDNNYWPRKYLIDIDGFIVYDHIGEGAYEQTENKIRQLLKERADRLGEEVNFSQDNQQPEEVDEADHRRIGTSEIYFGAFRNSEYLANGTVGQTGIQNFIVPEQLIPGKLYLEGSWDIKGEYAENQEGGAKIVLEYTAKKVNIVAGSQSGINLKIYNDGSLVSSDAGVDVENGTVTIQEEGLYNIIENEDYETHTLEIEVENPGAEIFTFTFG